jgi:gas vesicle protein
MYYDDEARRFNFLTGLLLGAALGAGVALIVRPQRRSRKPAGVLKSVRKPGSGARRRAQGLTSRVRGAASGTALRNVFASR